MLAAASILLLAGAQALPHRALDPAAAPVAAHDRHLDDRQADKHRHGGETAARSPSGEHRHQDSPGHCPICALAKAFTVPEPAYLLRLRRQGPLHRRVARHPPAAAGLARAPQQPRAPPLPA